MYEYLSGTISELAPTHAVLDVGGVGYFLQISLQTYSEIEHSDRVKLFVHYVVREDAQLLYGFASKAERELFRHLISVSGVGGNTARMILSTYSPRELQGIIATENAVLLKNVKGLGLKTAQKIIVELSGKMAGLGLTGDTVTAPVAGDRGCNSIPRQSQAGHLAAQLDDDLLRRFQPQSLDIFEKDGVFGSDDPLQLPRRIGRENHPGGIAAYAGDTYQVAEQFPFGLRREAVKQLGVFPNHVMNEQFHSVGVLDFGICLQRYLKKVPHSADIQHGMGGSEFGNGTGEIFVHEFLILNVA